MFFIKKYTKYLSLICLLFLVWGICACQTTNVNLPTEPQSQYAEDTIVTTESDITTQADTEIGISDEIDTSAQTSVDEEISVETIETAETIETLEATETNAETEPAIEAITEAETELETTPPISPLDIPDFVVNVASGKDPIVLQLTDPQIIDSYQQRTDDRLGGVGAPQYVYWAPENMDARCFDYIREIVSQTQPDLIIITGDIVYGEFDDKGTSFVRFVELMESFGIPWAPVFGNHDNESQMGVDWQCQQLENAQYCIFKQNTVTGNGNYSVGIQQDGKLTRVFYMLDSNGCGNASEASRANGQTQTTVGFAQDQIDWYTQQINALHAVSPDTKISFAYHVQQTVFKDAYAKYGFTNSGTKDNPINIDLYEGKTDGDFGYLGRDMKNPWDANYKVWYAMKALGVDSVFVGHEHCNSASVVYKGVRFQYGQKSSTYDRANYVDMSTGEIFGASYDAGTPLVGGTVIPLAAGSGELLEPYIYYCEEAGGNIDWSQWDEDEDAVLVDGLQYGDDFTISSGLTLETMLWDGKAAYVISATSQNKVYIDVSLLKGKSTFTFSVYVPNGAPNLSNYGETAIRYKTSGGNGYVDFNTKDGAENQLLTGQWQTFTIDVSRFASVEVTEFAFIVPAGGTVYYADMSFS